MESTDGMRRQRYIYDVKKWDDARLPLVWRMYDIRRGRNRWGKIECHGDDQIRGKLCQRRDKVK
jgi:hypothetical protein